MLDVHGRASVTSVISSFYWSVLIVVEPKKEREERQGSQPASPTIVVIFSLVV